MGRRNGPRKHLREGYLKQQGSGVSGHTEKGMVGDMMQAEGQLTQDLGVQVKAQILF